ncbi:MAG: PQQ-dependent sugar dehydrogenase [Desulfosalsimonadaceae bacterium]
MRKRIFACLFILLLAVSCNTGGDNLFAEDTPIVGDPPQRVEDNFIAAPENYTVEPWVQGLEIPWSLVFLTDDKALVTERPGAIRLIENGHLRDAPYKTIDAVEHRGEGGLLGIAKHPDYPDPPYLYVMYTYQEDGTLFNRVGRYSDTGETLSFDRVIVEQIPGNRVHDGGRIAFGPDGMLYVCTGDTWEAEIAQERDNLGGKILRFTPGGGIPEDNPFEGSPVYSLGHRNPQGIAWHPETGDLFSSEHGPSGEYGLRDKDIINVIKKGGNYGWPLVLGDAGVDPYIDPIIMWPRATPPSGMAFWNNALYVATLRSEALVRINVEPAGDSYDVKRIDRLFASDWFEGTYGRLRDAVTGPDDALYVLTSNRDGRGSPRDGDDKILRLTRRQSSAN